MIEREAVVAVPGVPKVPVDATEAAVLPLQH